MATIVSHLTALRILSSPRTKGIVSTGAAVVSAPLEAASRSVVEDAVARLPERLGVSPTVLGSVDVLVPRGTNRLQGGKARVHSWQGELPEHALLCLGGDLYLSSPEFCFLQMAASLDALDLMLLGASLCGLSFPAYNKLGFVKCQPLTTPERLSNFLSAAGRRAGIERARQAAQWTAADARSLMEVAVWLLFSLPRVRGGFGLPGGVLNQQIYLSDEARRLYPHEYCEADLMIPGSNDVFEYLGAAFHRSAERDISRTLALEHDGYRVRELTIYQVVDQRQLYEVARSYARAARKDLIVPTPQIVQKRRALIDRLIPKRESLGPDGSIRYGKPAWTLPEALT